MSEKSVDPSRSDPFKLLKALLIGFALGFIAVLVTPYIRGSGPKTIGETETAADTKDQSSISKVASPEQRPVTPPASEAQSEKTKPVEQAVAEKTPPIVEKKAETPSTIVTTNPTTNTQTSSTTQTSTPTATPSTSTTTSPPANTTPATTPQITEQTPAKAPSEPVLVPANVITYPKPFSSDEAAAALKPVLEFRVSDADLATIKSALEASAKGDVAGARALAAKITEPAGRKLVEWSLLRLQSATYKDLRAFRETNPLFPAQNMDSRIETRLFLASASPEDVLAFFAHHKPDTGVGKLSYGLALISSGDKERGLRLIKQAWTRHDLDADVQARFTAKYGYLLEEADREKRRAWIAFRAQRRESKAAKTASDSGFKSSAKQRARYARHMHKHKHDTVERRRPRRRHEAALEGGHDEADQGRNLTRAGSFKLASAVQIVALRRQHGYRHHPPVRPDKKGAHKAKEEKPKKTAQQKAAENAVNLKKELAADPATLLARLKSLQHQGKNKRLWSLLLSMDPSFGGLVESERWWDFKRNEIRRALNLGHAKIAYRIAKAHGALDDEAFSEAEFLSGFIALRIMKDPQTAERHFTESLRTKSSTRDEARALYWLGRAQHEQHKLDEAKTTFADAAKLFYTFYGQLAAQTLNEKTPCEFRAPPAPTPADAEAFASQDVVKAIMIVKQLDNANLQVTFFLDLARQLDDPAQMTLLMELAERTASPHVAVRAAKIALLRGFKTEAYAFPTLLPKFNLTPATKKLESALLHSLTRQESEFHTTTVSGVGARGLMQLMPQTARLMASATKTKYDQGRLTSDPSYNVSLGTAYLAYLMSNYNGSYIMSLAAYNAGPGRIETWVKEAGDPRGKSVDPIDWVERIPFTETREYVQRIVEGTQLYRCRMEQGHTSVQTFQDLHRGKPGKLPDTAQLFDKPE